MDVMGSKQSNSRDWIQAMKSNADSYACQECGKDHIPSVCQWLIDAVCSGAAVADVLRSED